MAGTETLRLSGGHDGCCSCRASGQRPSGMADIEGEPAGETAGTTTGYSYEDAISQEGSNHWSATEYNSNNAWNVNFGSGNVNNNNKYNGNVARAVTAYGVLFLPFYLSVAQAYQDCLKGKMSSPQAVQYMEIARDDLVSLAVELWTGTYVKPGRLYLSNRTRARMMERCNGFRKLMEEKDELNVLDCQRIEQVINSYLGFCKGRETYAFRRQCIEDMGEGFWKHFYVKGHFESIRTRRRYRGVEI